MFATFKQEMEKVSTVYPDPQISHDSGSRTPFEDSSGSEKLGFKVLGSFLGFSLTAHLVSFFRCRRASRDWRRRRLR